MGKTIQEKLDAKAIRAAEKEARAEKYPGFSCACRISDVHLCMDDGYPAIYVEVWEAESPRHSTHTFDLSGPELADLIHALTCRYNAMVEEQNAIAAKISMQNAKLIEF